jgi:hypothetical protein
MNNPLSVPETTTATPNQWTTYTVTNSDDIYLTDKFIHSSNGLPLEPNETYTASSTVTLPSYVAGSGYLLDLLHNFFMVQYKVLLFSQFLD